MAYFLNVLPLHNSLKDQQVLSLLRPFPVITSCLRAYEEIPPRENPRKVSIMTQLQSIQLTL